MKQADPFYMSIEWRKVRDKVLRRDGFRCATCGVRCLGKDKGKPSPHVDHIVTRKANPARALDPTNLRTLCHSCHSKRTRSDQLDRPPIGADGYPL